MKSWRDIELNGKRVLMRIDLNSSVEKNMVLESARFKKHADSIREIEAKKPEVIVLLAHQGRKGDKDFIGLKQHAKLLGKYIKARFMPIPPGQRALNEIKKSRDRVILLENTRFLDDETEPEKKDNVFIVFARYFDVFIQDAFSVCHRKSATTVLIPKLIKSCIGQVVEEELKNADKLVRISPLLLCIGGEKVEDYLGLASLLKNKKNKLVASGYFDFLIRISQGVNYGMQNNLIKDKSGLIKQVSEIFKKFKKQIILPVDYAVEDNGKRKEILFSELPVNKRIFDIGSKSIELFSREIKKASAVFIKGDLGYAEDKRFAKGTVAILSKIAGSARFSFIGGGSISTVIEKYKLGRRFSYISLSGGALISYLSGENLPGLEALR